MKVSGANVFPMLLGFTDKHVSVVLIAIPYYDLIDTNFTFELHRCRFYNVSAALSIGVQVAIIQSIICSTIIYFHSDVNSCGRMHQINMDKKI